MKTEEVLNATAKCDFMKLSDTMKKNGRALVHKREQKVAITMLTNLPNGSGWTDVRSLATVIKTRDKIPQCI